MRLHLTRMATGNARFSSSSSGNQVSYICENHTLTVLSLLLCRQTEQSFLLIIIFISWCSRSRRVRLQSPHSYPEGTNWRKWYTWNSGVRSLGRYMFSCWRTQINSHNTQLSVIFISFMVSHCEEANLIKHVWNKIYFVNVCILRHN